MEEIRRPLRDVAAIETCVGVYEASGTVPMSARHGIHA